MSLSDSALLDLRLRRRTTVMVMIATQNQPHTAATGPPLLKAIPKEPAYHIRALSRHASSCPRNPDSVYACVCYESTPISSVNVATITGQARLKEQFGQQHVGSMQTKGDALTGDASEDADDGEGDGGVGEQVEVPLELLLVACTRGQHARSYCAHRHEALSLFYVLLQHQRYTGRS